MKWAVRIGSAFMLWLVVTVAARLMGNQPRVVLLALVVAAFSTVLWLYLDASADREEPVWNVAVDEPVRPPGEDARLALLTRVVAQHHEAREVGDALQRHLMSIADHRLVAHHGVSWRADPERAETLLGPELTNLSRQGAPYPRMTLAQIDVLLQRIESL